MDYFSRNIFNIVYKKKLLTIFKVINKKMLIKFGSFKIIYFFYTIKLGV